MARAAYSISPSVSRVQNLVFPPECRSLNRYSQIPARLGLLTNTVGTAKPDPDHHGEDVAIALGTGFHKCNGRAIHFDYLYGRWIFLGQVVVYGSLA